MIKEIVLPVKCSTVRRADDLFSNLIFIEVFILAVFFSAYSIWGTMIIIYYPNAYRFVIEPFSFLFGWMSMIFMSLFIGPTILDDLPVVKCIEDEETP